jgi:phosphoenolpyruvate carboxykinase (ATP)
VGEVNRPLTPESFDRVLDKVRADFRERDLSVFDGFAGADGLYRLPVRVVTERAWHNLFARNMFIDTDDGEVLSGFEPGFTVVDACSLEADPAADGTRSATFIVLDLGRKLVIIGGTEYAGQIKKSIFNVMNYLLPRRGVLSMHCSANYGCRALRRGAVLWTLSADPRRRLIGDDEHGWSDAAVFNVEGDCYAKVIRLSPEIYRTTRTFGECSRNLTADAFGVLPPVFRLVPRAGDVPLPLRLHRRGRRHRARRDRAHGDVLPNRLGACSCPSIELPGGNTTPHSTQ